MSWTCRSWWSNTKISYPTLISGVCELWGWKPKKMKISYPSLNSGTLWIFDGLKHTRIIIWIKKLCHQSALKNEYVSSGVGANCFTSIENHCIPAIEWRESPEESLSQHWKGFLYCNCSLITPLNLWWHCFRYSVCWKGIRKFPFTPLGLVAQSAVVSNHLKFIVM